MACLLPVPISLIVASALWCRTSHWPRSPWITVTNPPFALARQFVDHALELARRKIPILFPIARLNAARWLEDTSFRQLWLLTPRPSMPPGEVILRGEKPGGGKTDFAWLVFEQGYTGEPAIGWLRREVQ
jgi:hypothetical protein